MSASPSKRRGATSAKQVGQPSDLSDRRDELVNKYYPYAIKVASNLRSRLSFHTDVDDVIGWAFMGLIEAATRFDPARGISFRTYAHHRIRGAILDAIRHEFGRGGPCIRYLDEPVFHPSCSDERDCVDRGYETFSPPLQHHAHAVSHETQERDLLRIEIRDRLEQAMTGLSRAERLIIEHTYLKGLPAKALSRRLKRSKTWISRCRARALAKLRANLDRTVEREALL